MPISFGQFAAGLGILLSLFFLLSYLFRWAHRFGWSFLISRTERMLTGKLLRKFELYRALWCLVYAVVFLLFFFDTLSTARLLLLFLALVLQIGIDIHFPHVAK